LACGPDIRSGELDKISIKDIAPTALHLSGVAVPTDMEGDVLDIFTEDSEIETTSVKKRRPIDIHDSAIGGSEEVEQRLEDLGYLGQ
jgi:hypothetical protein